jgi:hypothetical protein
MPARRLSPSFRARMNVTIEPPRTRRRRVVGWIWIVARPSTFVRTSVGAWIHPSGKPVIAFEVNPRSA